MAVEELFQWGELFKFPVRPLQDGFIGIIQPVTLTFGYGIQSLRIELAVVDGDIRIDGTGDLNADETAAARVLAGMKKYVDGGEEVYPLRYALEDAYTANLMTTAAGNSWQPQNSQNRPWK